MKPICLIIPPSLFLLDERVFMTLGILRVAAVLEKAGYPVEVLDLSGIENFTEAVEYHAQHSSSQIFGLTSTTPQMPAATRIAETLRKIRPEARLILGGPHPTLVNAAYKKEATGGTDGRATAAFKNLQKLFNVVVAGDGEEAIFAAIGPNPPALVDADEPKSPLFLNNQRLNELPFPARHLVDVDSYHYFIEGERALSMIAQLGCPFSCGFCGGRESPMLRRVRMRTTQNVVAELQHLYHSYKVRGYMLYDDELNVNPQMIELMQAIERVQSELNVEFRLRGFIKAQLFTDEQAEAMRRAGFRWILTGFESGSPRILENINKRATREENTRCVNIARRHGLKVKALMSIGHPGESQETIRETQDWLLETKPEDFDVTIITTYPGTPYYDQAVRHPSKKDVWVYTYQKTGDRLYSYEVDYMRVADYYKGDPNGGYKSFVYTDTLSPEQLVAARDQMERDVRAALNIPFNPSGAMTRFEHSMGQFGLPPSILRVSSSPRAVQKAS
jgi:anaerobic magnesium-protoporphyrin IX monomethyl ester cyclase